MNILIVSLLIIVNTLSNHIALADDIVIKGLYIGMPSIDAESVLKKESLIVVIKTYRRYVEDYRIESLNLFPDQDREDIRRGSNEYLQQFNFWDVIDKSEKKLVMMFFNKNCSDLNNAGKIYVDKNGKVMGIDFSSCIAHKIFEARSLSAENFVLEFCKTYRIDKMEKYRRGSTLWWRYNSPDGIKISINDNKAIFISKTKD
jgi:hypothetical protein